MPDPVRKRLEKHVALSERNRFTLRLRTVEAVVEEDTFLWGLADLMTILLIFFILLYSTANHTPVPVETQITGKEDLSVKNEQKPPDEILPVPEVLLDEILPPPEALPDSELLKIQDTSELEIDDPPGEITPAWDQESLEFFQKSASDDFYIRWDEQRPTFVLGERITFKVGQAELLADFQSILRQLAGFIASIPTYQVLVSGHTDNTPINTTRFPSNWELSAVRAVRVAKFLIANGVAAHRLTIQGHAEYEPLYVNTSKKNQQANRRVEITLVRAAEKLN